MPSGSRCGSAACGRARSGRSAARAEVDAYREDIERRAARYGLQPLRWPDPFPSDAEWAMLAATYAKQIGRAVAFSLAAFRQAYAGGRDLGDPDTVLLAAAACEMHPAAVEKGARLALDPAPPRRGDGGGRARPACSTCRPCGSATASSTATASSRRRRRRWRRHEGQPRVRAARAPAAAAGRRCCAGPDRIDHIEVVEIATGEVALFWDTRPRRPRRLARGAARRPRSARGRRVHREVAPLAGGMSGGRRTIAP